MNENKLNTFKNLKNHPTILILATLHYFKFLDSQTDTHTHLGH